jgi:hypothetical protein
MPIAKMLWQPTPFAALFGNIQQRIELAQIGHVDIAPLARQTVGNSLILALGKFHDPTVSS